MYENEYENYMRSVLGYSANNTYNVNSFPYKSTNNIKDNYEHLYPDIYKVLKPMVKKVCGNVRSMDISTEVIEDMANEIYNNIESDTMDVRNMTAETENSTKGNEAGVIGKSDYGHRGSSDASSKMGNTASYNQRGNSNTMGDYKSNNTTNKNTDELTRGCCGNPTLKDLIKILIITQLISNNQNRPQRPMPPPYPQCPPRPNYREFENSSFYNNNFYGDF